MTILYYDPPGYANAGRVQCRIRLEYEHESPEPLITSDLCIVATKNDEILHDDLLLWSLGICKSWD